MTTKRAGLFATTSLAVCASVAQSRVDVMPAANALRDLVADQVKPKKGVQILAFDNRELDACHGYVRISAIMPNGVENVMYRTGMISDGDKNKEITLNELDRIKGGYGPTGGTGVITFVPGGWQVAEYPFGSTQIDYSHADTVATLEEAIALTHPQRALKKEYKVAGKEQQPDPHMLVTDFINNVIDTTGMSIVTRQMNFSEADKQVIVSYMRRGADGKPEKVVSFQGKNNGNNQLEIGDCHSINGSGGQLTDLRRNSYVFGAKKWGNVSFPPVYTTPFFGDAVIHVAGSNALILR